MYQVRGRGFIGNVLKQAYKMHRHRGHEKQNKQGGCYKAYRFHKLNI